MSQNPTGQNLARASFPQGSPGSDDLDALLDSIMGEDPGARGERSSSATREMMRRRLEQQRAEEQRPRQAEEISDELRAQIRAIALQVQTLNESAAQQVANARAIQELRQAMRDLVFATHQHAKQSSANFNAEVHLPSLKIKLVLAQAAYLIHHADRDVTMLTGWAMLFGGITAGTLLAIILDFFGLQAIEIWIYLAVAFFAFIVAVVFSVLASQARRRVLDARKAMDESAMTRTIPMQ